MHAQDGCTALMNASENANLDCVRLLLEFGADIGAKSLEVRIHKLLASAIFCSICTCLTVRLEFTF